MKPVSGDPDISLVLTIDISRSQYVYIFTLKAPEDTETEWGTGDI